VDETNKAWVWRNQLMSFLQSLPGKLHWGGVSQPYKCWKSWHYFIITSSSFTRSQKYKFHVWNFLFL